MKTIKGGGKMIFKQEWQLEIYLKISGVPYVVFIVAGIKSLIVQKLNSNGKLTSITISIRFPTSKVIVDMSGDFLRKSKKCR